MADLIDDEYIHQLRTLHDDGVFNNGKAAYKIVRRYIDIFRPSSILDFGCGHGALMREIKNRHPNIVVRGYDPGSREYSEFPREQFDAVISTDVLEHIEPHHIDDTLIELGRIIQKHAFLRIACYPAAKALPDGRNAHLIVERPAWWRQNIERHMGVTVLKERIRRVDKSDRWACVKGENYDVVVAKSDWKPDKKIKLFAYRYLYRKP